MNLIISSVSQGFLWSLLAMGVFLTFRILGIADMSAEGSFPLGAAVSSVLIVNGQTPIIATICGAIAGLVAGFITGFMHTKMKIPGLLAGILTMTGLYSINLRIMGQANLPLLGEQTLFSQIRELGLPTQWSALLVGVMATVIVIAILVIFMKTQIGLSILATGENEIMAEANGIKTDTMKIIGLMISNGLISLSGALMAQNNGYSDISMGTGTIVIGLAALIISEVIFKDISFGARLASIILGAAIYRIIIDLIMQQTTIAILPSDIKVLSAIALALILWAPTATQKIRIGRLK